MAVPNLDHMLSYLYLNVAGSKKILEQDPSKALGALEQVLANEEESAHLFSPVVDQVRGELAQYRGLTDPTQSLVERYAALFDGFLQEMDIGQICLLAEKADKGNKVPDFNDVVPYTTKYKDLRAQYKEVEAKVGHAKVESKKQDKEIDPELTEDEKRILKVYNGVEGILDYAKACCLHDASRVDRDNYIKALKREYGSSEAETTD